jgi:hypothetical protein
MKVHLHVLHAAHAARQARLPRHCCKICGADLGLACLLRTLPACRRRWMHQRRQGSGR